LGSAGMAECGRTCGNGVHEGVNGPAASALEWARLAHWTAGRRVRGWGVLGGKPTKPRAKAPRRLPRRWVRRDTGVPRCIRRRGSGDSDRVSEDSAVCLG